MIYVGIDPGVTGGVVALDDEGQFLHACRTPSIKDKSKRQYDVRGMAEVIADLRSAKYGSKGGRLTVGIEKVGAMPRDGRVGAFSFGKGYGIWLGILAAMEVPYTEVPPQRWQAKMLAGMARGPQVKVSAVTRARALYPTLPIRVKADWGMADAGLIAGYLHRVHARGEA